MANLSNQVNEAANKINSAARDVKSSVQYSARSGVDQARGTAQDVRDFIQNEAPDYLKHALADMRDTADRAMEMGTTTVKRYPLYSVLGAVAVGAAVGLFLGKRK